jgi:hypothetical protein
MNIADGFVMAMYDSESVCTDLNGLVSVWDYSYVTYSILVQLVLFDLGVGTASLESPHVLEVFFFSVLSSFFSTKFLSLSFLL